MPIVGFLWQNVVTNLANRNVRCHSFISGEKRAIGRIKLHFDNGGHFVVCYSHFCDKTKTNPPFYSLISFALLRLVIFVDGVDSDVKIVCCGCNSSCLS